MAEKDTPKPRRHHPNLADLKPGETRVLMAPSSAAAAVAPLAPTQGQETAPAPDAPQPAPLDPAQVAQIMSGEGLTLDAPADEKPRARK